MIDGPKLTLGDREFIVPPANLKAIKAHSAVRKNPDATPEEKIDANIAFILTTLQRNYPDLTEDFLLEHVDARNQMAVMAKVLESAGYVKEAAAGETPAEAAN
jgi:hypothetical protein